jgi:hypothetical protein
VVKFEGLVSPYGVAVLDNKIIVSDIELNKVFSLEKDGRLYGIFGSAADSRGRFVKPSSVTVSDNEVYVLDSSLKTIQSYSLAEIKSKTKDKEGNDVEVLTIKSDNICR